ncbi:CU044_5270 family protein [Kribbella sp. NPDC050124]|uniref:CU044_5270 family protein n=1 Tax=Kribbella sp. NPDC050124 TaxID=3364114 RepID=UPI0037B848DB
MNDLERIRKAFPEAEAPSAQATAAARRQVEALIREAESDHGGRVYAFRSMARAGWIGSVVTAVTAVLTVVGLGVPLLHGVDGVGEAAPATVTPSAPRLASASRVLIAVAQLQETDEKVSGKFFRVRSLQVNGTRRVVTESWMPMKPGVQSWFGWVSLTSPTEPVVNKMAFDEVPPGYYLTGDKPLTAQQIAALPTDPVKLRAVLSRAADPEATASEREYVVFAAAGRLLFEMPSPPKLRGAALRVLATLPDTRVRTDVKDPIGRIGTEIIFTPDPSMPSAGKTFLHRGGARYIIDPVTGRLLSSSYRGFKPGATVVLESGWTDEKPKPPSRAVR